LNGCFAALQQLQQHRIPPLRCGCAAPLPCADWPARSGSSVQENSFKDEAQRFPTRDFSCRAPFGAVFHVLASPFFLTTLRARRSFCADKLKNPRPTRTYPAPDRVPSCPAVRTCVLTHHGVLTLRLTTDLGSCNIVPLEAGSAPVVRYPCARNTMPSASRVLSNFLIRTPQGQRSRLWRGITSRLHRNLRAPLIAQFLVQCERSSCRAATAIEVNTDAATSRQGTSVGPPLFTRRAETLDRAHRWFGLPRRFLGNASAAKLEPDRRTIQFLDVAGTLAAFTEATHHRGKTLRRRFACSPGRAIFAPPNRRAPPNWKRRRHIPLLTPCISSAYVRVGGHIDFGEVLARCMPKTGGVRDSRHVTFSGVHGTGTSTWQAFVFTPIAGALQGGHFRRNEYAWSQPRYARRRRKRCGSRAVAACFRQRRDPVFRRRKSSRANIGPPVRTEIASHRGRSRVHLISSPRVRQWFRSPCTPRRF